MVAMNRREAREYALNTVNRWGMNRCFHYANNDRCLCTLSIIHPLTPSINTDFVIQIGAIYGVDLDRKAACSLFEEIVNSFANRIMLADLAISFLFTILRSMLIQVVITEPIGKAIIKHFEGCSPLPV